MTVDKEWLAAAVHEINTQGYTKLAGFLSPQALAETKSCLSRHLGHFQGRNNFEGTLTERVYTLVGREKVFQDVAEDVRQGYVSIEAARDSYGVVIEEATGEVDQAATDALRVQH